MWNSVFRGSRRAFLGSFAFGAAAFTTPGLFAEELARIRTPAQTEGPFYPNKLPLDTDNDLLVVNDTITPAVGEVAHLPQARHRFRPQRADDQPVGRLGGEGDDPPLGEAGARLAANARRLGRWDHDFQGRRARNRYRAWSGRWRARQ